MPERMSAAMFVRFAIGTIVTGESEQIWQELADAVSQILSLADV